MLTNEDLLERVAGQTISSRFLETARDLADHVALRWRTDDGAWHEWTFADYLDRVARAAAAYRAHGVADGDRVVLMLRNVPEFHVLDMAAYFVGATPVSIYNSSSPDQIQYLVNHCGAVLGIADDAAFLDRFQQVHADMATMTTLGIVSDPDGAAGGDVVTFDDMLANDPIDLDQAATVAQPDDLATIIYTSGTTGPPKGVMLTHTNICWTVESLKETIGLTEFVGKRLVSYLPMAHIAERMTSHYQQSMLGFEVSCCPDPGQIAQYLGEVRPNIIFGVPRVWEKIYAGVTAALAADQERAKQFNEAIEAALPIVEKMDWGTATDDEVATWEFLDQVAFSTVRGLVGLDQAEVAISGAAPIPGDLLAWFRAVGIPLSEIYGMSESSGPMTYAASQVKPGWVGPGIVGCEVKLADDGEIVCRGGNVFVGYLNNPEATEETLVDQWLHSGDIGELDADGYFRIVDRKKELIITAGGKNVSPANLEAALKMIPLVGQACAVGDQRPFIAALVVLDPDVAPSWAANEGLETTALGELADHPRVVEEIERGLEEVMAPFNNAERVKKVKILGEEWLPDSDLLTPTSKLKRRGVLARYAEEIESLYS
ncbi:MAG: long-chain fatty acid--CoA ligase [Acidimicrobiales bacterium]|nr:long-chain fatty acid--CoA ligase [Acidimicrobiales bacterium]